MPSIRGAPQVERLPRAPSPVPINDAACDPCRLRKIRCCRQLPVCSHCTQAQLDCSWTNKGKKPNQVKILANDFEKLGGRLGALESKVDQLLSAIKDIPNHIAGLEPRTASVSSISTIHGEDLAPNGGARWNHEDSHRPQTSAIVSFTTSEQRHHGSSSLISLLLQSDISINNSLQPATSLREVLLFPNRSQESSLSWDLFFSHKEKVYRELSRDLALRTGINLPFDNRRPLLPPRPLLESLLDGYFHHINLVTPLLERTRVEKAIAECYGAPSIEPDLAWVVIFNYITIRCLAGRHMPLEQPITDMNIVSANYFDQPFVNNIRGIFGMLDKLMTPRLANVQALGSLALIAQKYFSVEMSQTLLDRSCYLAKGMGLHQQQVTEPRLQPEQFHEQQSLFWLLFTLDKNLSLLLGYPPSLPLFDCDVPMPKNTSHDQIQRLKACIVQERIYTLLYSASSRYRSDEQREKAVEELEEDLTRLEELHDQADPEDPRSGWKGMPFLKIEMKFIYHQLRVTILRCSKNPEKKQRCLTEARLSIAKMEKIRLARTTIGGSTVLRRPFQWHCFTPFFELYSALFVFPLGPSQLDDFNTLKRCVTMLKDVAGIDSPSTYCDTLLRAATACVGIADAFIKECQSHQMTRSLEADLGPVPESRKRRYQDSMEVESETQYPNTRLRRMLDQGECWEPNHRSRDESTHSGGGGSACGEVQQSILDPMFGCSEAELQEILGFSDDLMWGGDDVFAAQ